MKNNLQTLLAGSLKRVRCVLLGAVLLASGGVALPVRAEEGTGLRITYDVEGASLTFLRDAAGFVQVDGLDVPGLVMYRPVTKTVYYQNPAWPRWLVVGPDAFEGIPNVVQGVAGAAWAPFMGKPVRRWELSVPAGTCGTWFGSPGIAAVVGMGAADVLRILGVVNWLNGGQHLACHVMMPAGEVAENLGWPVRWQDEHATWQLREVSRVQLTDFVLPADVEPVTGEARLALMMTQLTTEERKAFVVAGRGLPLVEQLNLLVEVLAEGVD